MKFIEPNVIYCRYGCGRGIDVGIFPETVQPYDCCVCQPAENDRRNSNFNELLSRILATCDPYDPSCQKIKGMIEVWLNQQNR